MKILLLTDMPPCKNFTAGLVLDQLCRFLPRGSIACFCVGLPELNARVSPDLDWIPIRYMNRPWEVLQLFKMLPAMHSLVNLGLHYFYKGIRLKSIISQVVGYGREVGADILWCPLQGETQIRLALPVSEGLHIPLVTQVYDHPTWILRAYSTPGFLQKKILRKFKTVLNRSRMCATASLPMAEQYHKWYGVNTVPFLPSLDQELALPPARNIHDSHDLIVGLAGQLYATNEWQALLTTLNSVGWKIAGRNVRIRLLGRWVSFNTDSQLHIEYLGWHTQESTIKLLSETDILYCPYSTDKTLETEMSLSFPSKLTTYLAAGRPVFFHGPENSAPAIFLTKNKSGYICSSNSYSAIRDALSVLVNDRELYLNLTHSGRVAFDTYLTLSTLRKQFATFLQVDEEFLLPLC